MTEISIENLKKIIPSCRSPEIWVGSLNRILPKFDIDTKSRVAMFIAQCAHESGDFNRVIENLNYSKDGLLKVFPKYFDEKQAEDYARKPSRIASRVYANRMGNGDEQSEDGYKYRGRGLIQLTGKTNYTKFSRYVKGDDSLLVDPTYCETVDGAIESACWYWKVNNLNVWADKNDFDGVSDIVNRGRKTVAEGDSIGYADRKKHYDVAMSIL